MGVAIAIDPFQAVLTAEKHNFSQLLAQVSNISFVDLDLDLGELGGNISWMEPSLSRRVAWIEKI